MPPMETSTPPPAQHAVVIGGGPAGLMAADVLSAAGWAVDLYDAMPSVGRKFLLAGRGGLNLTHSEPYERFVTRFGARAPALQAALDAFTPDDLRDWAAGLGVDTFVGSSGRVFPADLKAAPLLRAWLRRLHAQGVHFHSRHRWLGWGNDGALRFATPAGEARVPAAPTLLALGGASWARLGSDGAWVPVLQAAGAALAPLQPSNCGFAVQGGWSAFLRERFAGQPVKPVSLTFEGRTQQGEFVLTDDGVEGSLVYAFSAALRDAIARDGQATLHLDLLPQHPLDKVREILHRGLGAKSLASFLKSQFKLSGLKPALLHEVLGASKDPAALAATLKALPLTLVATRPIDEAISTAGGVRFESLDGGYQLRAKPGVWVAGEMLDWEAPTGGYLLTACLATGRAAAQGILSAAVPG
ncbi:MAG: TIGR03862 family flavoprotein [Inhella sp.]|uniref:TIGR03862 family flavoprotein n=2 Tax=Inhella sp. TaxID=1921806 RepID=UPI00391943C1